MVILHNKLTFFFIDTYKTVIFLFDNETDKKRHEKKSIEEYQM